MEANFININIITEDKTLKSFEIDSSFIIFENFKNELSQLDPNGTTEVDIEIIVMIFFL